MICPCCSSASLKQTKSRCPNCKRTLAQRNAWLKDVEANGPKFDPVLEARRAGMRAWKPRTPVHPERREITARDLVGGNGRAGAEWLAGGAR